jgi:hypothetical protein
MNGLRPIGSRRWIILLIGTVLALCIYYLNYSATFDEGEIDGETTLTLYGRIGAVLLMCAPLMPIHLSLKKIILCVFFFGISTISLLFAISKYGALNDTLFVNTLLQFPIFLALVGTRWSIDYARWLRFLCIALAVQIGIDTLIWQSGASLWQSLAFVGGMGNPSSFAIFCLVAVVFCVFHPLAGRARWALAAILAVGALMTQALFAIFGLIIIVGIWSVLSWRRVMGVMAGGLLLSLTSIMAAAISDNEGTRFIWHKLNSVGAMFGLVQYNTEDSASVGQRVEMHQRTFASINAEPDRLLWGHLDGLPYWPMDSQLLTYLGSFGGLMLLIFLTMHFGWMRLAWHHRRTDGGFAIIALLLFALIFCTNRILDYYPVATLYFLVSASVIRAALIDTSREMRRRENWAVANFGSQVRVLTE